MSKTLRLLGQVSAAAAAIVGVTGAAHAQEAGWSANLEAAFLKPHASENNLPTTSDFSYESSWRAVIGYQDATGFGARFRYFNFDHDAGPSGSSVSISRNVYDFEGTQAFDFEHGSMTLAAGVRYVDASQDGVDYTAWGLTAAVEGTRNLGMEGLALTASARWAAVYGDTKFSGGFSPDKSDLHNSIELRLGPQYTFALNGGHAFTIGAGVDAEYLNNEPISFTDTQDAGFVGFYLNAGTRF